MINSFSKSYAMTGWRVGYVLAPADVMQAIVRLQENVVSCVNTAAQYGAYEALTGTQEPLKQMIAEYAKRRENLVHGINEIDKLSCLAPLGAFYAFPNITGTGLTSQEFSEQLLEAEHVVVVPGSGFGDAGEGFIRISYSASEEIINEGLKRIRRFVESLD